MRLGAFHCGGDQGPRALVDPFDPEPGRVEYFPYMFFLIEHERGRVLYDSGLHDKWLYHHDTVETIAIEAVPSDAVTSRLAKAGLAPADIDYVVAGHLHFDHAGGLQHFKHASVYVHPAELEFAYAPPVYQASLYDRDDFDHDLQWVEIDDGHDVFGDGKVVILHTPGHTPGHCSLLVELESAPYVLAGDVSYVSAAMRIRHLSAVVWNADATIASWDKIEALERDRGARLLFTHDQDFRERKLLAPAAWYD